MWGSDNSDEEGFTGEQWDSGTKSLSLSVKLMLSMDSKLARTWKSWDSTPNWRDSVEGETPHMLINVSQCS